ncbi:BRO family protein [Serratia sp. BW106]|uniref:BRO family protein n=1 Tax=Serratia sp. BW106 TaxID=1884636 RepID=UPI000BFFD256|nr:BRO family protein [Serratia sp. BW106]
MKELTFENHAVVPYENGDGKIWFTGEVLSDLLGYADVKQVNKIYQRHKDEFTSSMTILSKVTVSNKNNELERIQLRLFSPRGAHLIGMVSRTKVAKSLRRWLLDLIERESQTSLALLDMEELRAVTIGEMQNRVVKANEWSLETFGRPGSVSMNTRKRHLKQIRAAEKLIAELSQVKIPDLGGLQYER